MTTKDFLTVEEMAELLRVQESAIRNRLSRNDPTLPPSARIGGRRLFPVLAYEKWVQALLAQSPADPMQTSQMTSISEPRRGRPRQKSRGLT